MIQLSKASFLAESVEKDRFDMLLKGTVEMVLLDGDYADCFQENRRATGVKERKQYK